MRVAGHSVRSSGRLPTRIRRRRRRGRDVARNRRGPRRPGQRRLHALPSSSGNRSARVPAQVPARGLVPEPVLEQVPGLERALVLERELEPARARAQEQVPVPVLARTGW